jgi:hypothetical protein
MATENSKMLMNMIPYRSAVTLPSSVAFGFGLLFVFSRQDFSVQL